MSVAPDQPSSNVDSSSTPILDRIAPLPQPLSPRHEGTQRAVGVILGLAICAAFIAIKLNPSLAQPLRDWLAVHVGRTHAGAYGSFGPLVGALTAVVVFMLALAIHELGHVVAGVAVGFRFVSLRLGPLHVDRRLRMSFRRARGSGYLGWASMAPTRRDHLRWRAAIFVLAGPGVNLATAAGLLLPPVAMGFFATILGLVSLALGLKELLPLKYRTAVSDGRRLWMLWRNDGAARRWVGMMRLGTEIQSGVPPEDLPAEWVAEVVALEDDSPDTVSAHLLAFAVAFHQHRDAEAGRLLETALRHAGHTPEARDGLICNAATFQGRRRKNADLATQWLADLPAKSPFPWLRLQAEAAVLEARNDFDGARRKLDEMETAFDSLPDPAQRDRARHLIARWRAELEQQAVGVAQARTGVPTG